MCVKRCLEASGLAKGEAREAYQSSFALSSSFLESISSVRVRGKLVLVLPGLCHPNHASFSKDL